MTSCYKHALSPLSVPHLGPETREKNTERGSNSEKHLHSRGRGSGCSGKNKQEERGRREVRQGGGPQNGGRERSLAREVVPQSHILQEEIEA